MSDKYFSENPTTHRYYRNIAFGMTLFCVGKQEWWGYKPYKNILVLFHAKCWALFGPVAIALLIVNGFQNFRVLRKYHLDLLFFISVVVYTTITLKILTAQRAVYKQCVTNFMKEFHLYHVQDVSEFNKKKAITMERISHYIQYLFLFFMFVDVSLWDFTPLARNIKNLERIHNRTMILQGTTYMWMPFDYMYNFRNWLLLEVFVIYLQYGGCVAMFCVDVITFTFLFHVIGHLAILKHRINNQIWDGLDDSAVRQILVEQHKYYVFIKRNFKTFESAYAINIGSILLFNLIADSLLMYQLMFDEKENRILYLLMALYFMVGLVTLSYVAEEIRKLSDDVATSIYFCPWEAMSISNQKMLLLMLVQWQDPLDLKFCGLSVGYNPTISIIKTTFSYYVMLKNTNE